MITVTQTGRSAMLEWLKRGVALTGGLYVVLAVFLCAQIYMQRAEAESAGEQLKAVQLETQKADAEISRGEAVGGKQVVSDLSAVAKFQSAMESKAASEHCDLAEFRASSDITPYLTRFAKTATVSGWGQVEAQATLNGPPKSVLATIAGLGDCEVPYEFDSLEIKRDKINSAGDALVSAHITMRVLIRMEQKAR